MDDSIEIRRRRLAWRAWHRGTKELDFVLGRYADAALAGMGEAELHRFERFLAVPDPDLHGWIIRGNSIGEEDFIDIVRAVRRFHGIDRQTSRAGHDGRE